MYSIKTFDRLLYIIKTLNLASRETSGLIEKKPESEINIRLLCEGVLIIMQIVPIAF